MNTNEISIANGRSVIERYAKDLPGTPGVYRMVDAENKLLYVGKAKNLKNRVTSYLNIHGLSIRMQRVIAQTASMEFTTTRSEAEALMLEANIVKSLSPRYNILLKDDKSFPYIRFTDRDFPQIVKYRGARTEGKFFGPFVSASAVNETITLMQKAFLLRSCSDNTFKNRSRPCILYQIKRCSAPCVNLIAKENYAKLVDQAEAFLSGKSTQIQSEMVAEMQEFSLQMHFEKARVVRDRLRALAHVQQQNGVLIAHIGDADVIALARKDKDCCIQMYSIRGGRNYGNKAWFPVHTANHTESDILQAFIAQAYQDRPPPALILVNHPLEETALLEEGLKLRTDYKVDIVHPLRGEKRDILQEAIRNAEESLERHLSMRATQEELLLGIQKLFGLEEVPQRIEVYDNSHISGTNAVGVMVVAGPEGFNKNRYRLFNIKSTDIAPGDDYAMLREVLTRRFRHLQEQGKTSNTPDLVLIDGGAGQLSTACKVLEDSGIQGVTLVGIAKGPDRNAGREQFFMPGRAPFQLPPDDAVLHYLQRLRDEAHRFAIGSHRNRRSKSMQTSELDSIPAIGMVRKKALLHHFGSARAVAAASMEEIEKVEGISKATAKLIYGHFHGDR